MTRQRREQEYRLAEDERLRNSVRVPKQAGQKSAASDVHYARRSREHLDMSTLVARVRDHRSRVPADYQMNERQLDNRTEDKSHEQMHVKQIAGQMQPSKKEKAPTSKRDVRGMTQRGPLTLT